METAASANDLPRWIHESYAHWATSQPAHCALTDPQMSLTYGELPQRVSALADFLSAAGVRAGDRVLLVSENCVALVACVLAISQLGAWSANVNARLSEREIDNFLQHSGARRALYFHAVSPEAEQHGRRLGAQVQQFPGIGPVMLGPLNEQAEVEPVEDDPARQVAVMVYTSGTTGAPKGVMLTHSNLVFVGNNSKRMRRLVPSDRIYGVLPLSHVYGLSSLMAASLLSGSTLQLAARFDPAELARVLAEDGISVMHGAPAMYARLLEWGARTGTALRAPQLRVAQAGGAPLTLALKQDFERIFGVTLHNGYGMSEASPSIAQTRLDAPRSDCSVGPAIPGIEICLRGAEQSADGIGELCVRGPNIMKGYYREPEMSAQTVTADGWLLTGDLAQIGADGAIAIVGRSKELIIRSGFNVYPVEVEQALNAHPDIVQSAVVGRNVPGNEEVVAYIEPVPGAKIDDAALKHWLRDQLSPYKIPSTIVVLERLPAAATGKILKKELQLRAASGTDD